MGAAPDRICCWVLVCLTAAIALAHGLRSRWARESPTPDANQDAAPRINGRATARDIAAAHHHHPSAGLAATAAGQAALWALGPVVRILVDAGVSANTVTAASLVFGLGAGVLLSYGHFGIAAVLLVVASVGDAVDGLVARASRTSSAGGALFDACVDRYEESFVLGGLAIYFRDNVAVLAAVLLALVGSYMVSYGSAKAEALGVAVPGGMMRRAERATCITSGCALTPIATLVSERVAVGGEWFATAPIVLAVLLVAVLANVSALRRLRIVAARVSPRRARQARPTRPTLETARAAARPGELSLPTAASADA
jgi:CDP-diacylglycerol--glycerol-3-phosphate 3-phosphatidyltransferase